MSRLLTLYNNFNCNQERNAKSVSEHIELCFEIMKYKKDIDTCFCKACSNKELAKRILKAGGEL